MKPKDEIEKPKFMIKVSSLPNRYHRNLARSGEAGKIKSGNRNNPYIEKWGSLYNTWTPTFRYTGYFCYLTLTDYEII